MKNSYDIEKSLDTLKYQEILKYDKLEIDNPDKRHPLRLMYLDRIWTIVNIVKRLFPAPKGISIGDFACAQANVGLILAEVGYKIYAVDINPVFIEYAKMKYEKGNIEWIVSNILDLELPADSLDCAIIGELIEHCAYPEELVEKILEWIRPNGYLILTTPNGSMFMRKFISKLPTFSQVLKKEKRNKFNEIQFGPSGADHLFVFRLDEIKYIMPENARILEKGYCGGTGFNIITRYILEKTSWNLFKIFPLRFLELCTRIFSKLPLINQKIYCNIFVVIKKHA